VSMALGFACDNANVVASRTPPDGDGDGGTAGSTPAASGGAMLGDAGAEVGGSGGSSASGAGDAGQSGIGGANDAGSASVAEAGNDAGVGGNSGGASSGSGGDAGAQHDGGAGTGGEAEGGSGGQSPPPTPVCDDGNACTADAFVDGACRNDPLADGTRCDDANFCSGGDHCEAGECVAGELLVGPAEVLGSVPTYGAPAGFSGAPIAVRGQDRFVFLDNMGVSLRVTLTQAEAGALRTLDSLDLTPGMISAVSTAWDGLIAAIDGDSSIIIGGDGRMLRLLSTTEDGLLEERGTLELDGSMMTSMTGHGNRLFLCSNFAFFSDPTGYVSVLDVSDPDSPTFVSETGFDAGSSCGSMAISEDGARLYVNTSDGVRFTDLTTYAGTGPLEFDAEPLVPIDAAVHVRGQRLLTRTGTGSEITVFDEATHAIEGRFTVADALLAGLAPTGVFVQGARAVGDGSELFAALYDYAGSLLEERIIATSVYRPGVAAQRPAISQNYALAPATMRLLEFTDQGLGDTLTPELGDPGVLFAEPDGAVHARGRYTASHIDVSDPTNPTILAGGPHGGPLGVRLDTSLSPPALLPDIENTSATTVYIGFGSPLIEQSGTNYLNRLLMPSVRADAGERLVPTGDIVELPGGAAALLSAGDFVYRAAISTANATARFQRWLSADLQQGIATPSLDLTLEVPAGATRVTFDVDPVARVAVIALGLRLHRIDLAEPSPTIETFTLSDAIGTSVRTLRVRNDWVVYTDGNSVGFFDLENQVEEILDPTQVPVGLIGAIPAFDGTTAFLSGSYLLAAVRRGRPEAALLGEFMVAPHPASLVETNGVLVVSSRHEILTIAPPCE
jgi:hypothetical protein